MKMVSPASWITSSEPIFSNISRVLVSHVRISSVLSSRSAALRSGAKWGEHAGGKRVQRLRPTMFVEIEYEQSLCLEVSFGKTWVHLEELTDVAVKRSKTGRPA